MEEEGETRKDKRGKWEELTRINGKERGKIKLSLCLTY
jgi:hypothetical protein